MPRGAPRLRAASGQKNQIGGRVRQRRVETGLTQDNLNARLAFVTVGAWNPSLQEVLHIENGTRTVTDLEILALAGALECDAGWLLRGDGKTPTMFKGVEP